MLIKKYDSAPFSTPIPNQKSLNDNKNNTFKNRGHLSKDGSNNNDSLLSPLTNNKTTTTSGTSTTGTGTTGAKQAKDYVESLHQNFNSKSQLIYGKNHIIVQQKGKDFAGYLSLHLNPMGLILKWTPNLLMSGGSASIPDESNSLLSPCRNKGIFWDYAMHIDINTIVYLHCHQQGNSGASVVLVAQDGVQYAPIKFPMGTHLLQFLTCLENGLGVGGHLDPPLYEEFRFANKDTDTVFGNDTNNTNETTDSSLSPRTKRKNRMNKNKIIGDENQDQLELEKIDEEEKEEKDKGEEVEEEEEEEEHYDFVFRIINSKSLATFTSVLDNSSSDEKRKQFGLSNSLTSGDNISITSTSSNNQLKSKFSSFFSNFSMNSTTSAPEFTSTTGTTAKKSSIDGDLAEMSSSSLNNSIRFSFSHSSNNNQEFIASPTSLGRSFNANLSSLGTPTSINNFNNKFQFSSSPGSATTGDFVIGRAKLNLKDKMLVRSSMKSLCDNMRRQILMRAFYGWLSYHRHLKTVSLHLVGLINYDADHESNFSSIDGEPVMKGDYTNSLDDPDFNNKLTATLWNTWIETNTLKKNKNKFYSIVYYNGIEHEIRKDVWPFLLEHYNCEMTKEERQCKDDETRDNYNQLIAQWAPFESFISKRESKRIEESLLINKTIKANNETTPSNCNDSGISLTQSTLNESSISNQNSTPKIFESRGSFVGNLFNRLTAIKNSATVHQSTNIEEQEEEEPSKKPKEEEDKTEMIKQYINTILNESKNKLINESSDNKIIKKKNTLNESFDTTNSGSNTNSARNSIYYDAKQQQQQPQRLLQRSPKGISTDLSIDEQFYDVKSGINQEEEEEEEEDDSLIHPSPLLIQCQDIHQTIFNTSNLNQKKKQSLSDLELVDNFALNIHRIDKDVTRCDRNYWYFTNNDNLKKLKNIVYTYVWENLNIGYIQGMCDLVAPLLVIFDDEPLVYSCFNQLMKRMSANFPHSNAMDDHFANMRSLIQILDNDLFEHMQERGDYTHFYFSYRWFLLDFKRELLYEDTFKVWETIWAAKYTSSAHFYLFIALALVEAYRDIIIDNNMDFTDIIKFFNEMAEKHNIDDILNSSRDLVQQLQNLINNK
jgi:hypothetical protein